jgi:hypothetical protein
MYYAFTTMFCEYYSRTGIERNEVNLEMLKFLEYSVDSMLINAEEWFHPSCDGTTTTGDCEENDWPQQFFQQS